MPACHLHVFAGGWRVDTWFRSALVAGNGGEEEVAGACTHGEAVAWFAGVDRRRGAPLLWSREEARRAEKIDSSMHLRGRADGVK